MPLTPAPNRRVLHRRDTIEGLGFSREDGGYQVEGRLTNMRTPAHDTGWRKVSAGGKLHDISVRLSLDRDRRFCAVDIIMAAIPYPDVCPSIAPVYNGLIGRRLDKGWSRAVDEQTGGTSGCAHVRELLGRMARTAFVTMFLDPAQPPGNNRAPFIGGCHALASDGAIVRKAWPAFHTMPTADNGPWASTRSCMR